MKKKYFGGILAAAVVLTITSFTVLAATFNWHEKLIEYFKPTTKQMENLSETLNSPMVSKTDNGITVNVLQTIADNHGVYVLYEIIAPSDFKFTDDIKWDVERFHIDYANEDRKPGMGGTMGSKVLSQTDNKRTVLLYRNGTGSIKNQTVKLTLSDLKYVKYDKEYTFKTIAKCDFQIEWNFNYKNLGKTIDINKKFSVNETNNNTLAKIDISPMSVWMTIEGDDAMCIIPIIKLKNKDKLYIDPKNYPNASHMFSNYPDSDGGTTTFSYNFDKITDIEDIESITIGDLTVPVN